MSKPTLAALAVPIAAAALLTAGTLVTREPAPAIAGDGVHATTTIHVTRSPGAVDEEGTWTITERENGRLQLNLHYETNSSWGRSVERADLRGLTDEQLRSGTSVPVAFRIEREAGVFDMEGAFREGRGAGHFRFAPNRQFAATLRSLGIRGADEVTDKELMHLALADASTANIRALQALELGEMDVDDLVQVSIFDVTPEYVREMRSLGIGGTNSVRGMVELRIHRISTGFVRELEQAGYRGLDRRQLLDMGIHGVTPEFIQQMRRAGFENLSARDLVDLRIHGVTPEYVREVRAAGLADELSARAAVEMRIHQVTPQFVRELEALGYRNLTRRQVMDMGIHGVTPDFIREVREAGFNDLSPETLVRMKIHGIDSDFVRGRRNRGG